MIKRTFILLLSLHSVGLLAQGSSSGVISLSTGPAWYQVGETQTLALYDDFSDTYVAGTTKSPLTTGELFLGLQQKLRSNIWGQLGFAFSTASKARPNGDIWETADPTFNNLSYNYIINHKQLALKGLLLSAPIRQLYQPYLGASVGVSFNESTLFSQTPKIFEAVPGPNFLSHQQAAFAYTLSAGVRRFISKHLQIGAGYEFGDWGKSALSDTVDQSLSGALTSKHVYTQELQISLTYLFSEVPA